MRRMCLLGGLPVLYRSTTSGYVPVHSASAAGLRLPYLSRHECGAPGVPWLSGATPPRSLVAFWGWEARRAATGSEPIMVTALGSMLAVEQRLLYTPHPEYHPPPTCLPDVRSVGVRHVERAINLLQAYGNSFWHVVAEILPRLLMVLPLVRADRDSALLLDPSAAAHQLLAILGVDASRIISFPPDGAALVTRLAAPTFAPFSWHSEPPRASLLAVRRHFSPLAQQLPLPAVRVQLAATGCSALVGLSLRRERELPLHFWTSAAKDLSQRLRGSGARSCVHSFHADSLPLTEQLALFGRLGACPVRALVGSHGANLVNMIWSSGPLAVVEVIHDDRRRFSNYWHLARALGFDHWLLPVSIASTSVLDLERLWRTVSQAIGVEPPRAAAPRSLSGVG
jgi:hypothetical protein